MKQLQHYWQLLAGRLDGLNLRERALIFAALAVAVVSLATVLLLDPLLARQKALSQQLVHDQGKMAQIQTNIQALALAHSADPDVANQQRLAQLKRQVGELNARLEAAEQGLVKPDRMAELLEGMLRRDRQLKLVALKTLPAAGLKESAGAAATSAQAGAAQPAGKAAEEPVYRHGVELTVEGSYSDLLRYLAQLEKLPWQMFWGKLSLAVEEYPTARLTLTLYTLGLDKAWLSI